jgi:hypothetical protein
MEDQSIARQIEAEARRRGVLMSAILAELVVDGWHARSARGDP